MALGLILIILAVFGLERAYKLRENYYHLPFKVCISISRWVFNQV